VTAYISSVHLELSAVKPSLHDAVRATLAPELLVPLVEAELVNRSTYVRSGELASASAEPGIIPTTKNRYMVQWTYVGDITTCPPISTFAPLLAAKAAYRIEQLYASKQPGHKLRLSCQLSVQPIDGETVPQNLTAATLLPSMVVFVLAMYFSEEPADK
jgi:hypothetical protein